MIKAAFFDIDRTLLSHVSNSVPRSARRALDLLRQRDILIFSASMCRVWNLSLKHRPSIS